MKTNNIIMGALVAVVAVMGVAFAAFSTTLTINGSATIDSSWSVVFTEANCVPTVSTDAGGAKSSATASLDTAATTATVTASMMSPGDTVTCTFKVKNEGSLAAKRTSWAVTEAPTLTVKDEDGGSVTAYTISVGPSSAGTTLAATTGTEELTLTITYAASAAEKPASSVSFKAQAVYAQDLSA